MKKILKLILLVLVLLLSYEAVAVYKARSVTTEKFTEILNSSNIKIQLVDIPQQRIDMLLKIQDPNFLNHNGLDFKTAGAGLTTITQAMVKYIYFDKFRAGFMKIEQSLIAWLAVNPIISKQDQLTVFINTAYLGTVENKAAKGFSEAANIYFDKSFSELEKDEYLALIAMLIAPDGYSVKNHSEKNRSRVLRMRKVLNGSYQPMGLNDVFTIKVANRLVLLSSRTSNSTTTCFSWWWCENSRP